MNGIAHRLRRWSGLSGWPAAALAALVICDLILLMPLSTYLRSWAALGLAILLPGLLLVNLLLGPRTDAGIGERFVYGMGAGLGLLVTLMLALSYWPGGLSFPQVAVSFNVLALLLLAGTLFFAPATPLNMRLPPIDLGFLALVA